MASSNLRSYLYPTAIILVVSVGSVYGANLKSQDQLESIRRDIQDPAARVKELEAYRIRLVAQRIIQRRKLDNWLARPGAQDDEHNAEIVGRAGTT